MNDPEYRKQELNKLLDSIDRFNKHYSPYENYGGYSSNSYISRGTYDECYDVMSPMCPYGIWHQNY